MLKKNVYIYSIIIVIMLLISAICYSCSIAKELKITSYRIDTNVTKSLRIVQLTDLHNTEFGENNCELIELIAEQRPDIIVMTGDMVNRDESTLDIIKNLISKLSEIAPVYYGYGNHETVWEENFAPDLHDELSSAGAIVLNNEFVDVILKEQEIRIGGYMGYYRQPGMFKVDDEQRALELAFADEFEDTDELKILLNHIPTQWVDWDYVNKYPVDVVFSGHFHGGLIRIPIIDRGVYAPYLGLFPKFTKGVYSGSMATCILSAGLGSEYWIPRINNPPEIVVVDLVPFSE